MLMPTTMTCSFSIMGVLEVKPDVRIFEKRCCTAVLSGELRPSTWRKGPSYDIINTSLDMRRVRAARALSPNAVVALS